MTNLAIHRAAFRAPHQPHNYPNQTVRAARAYAETGRQLAAHYQRTAQAALRDVVGGASSQAATRSITSVDEALDAARYNSKQAALQRRAYNTALAACSPQKGESLLDWGANTGALGFAAIERGEDHFDYLPVDGSSEAMQRVGENLAERFQGAVEPHVETDPLNLLPESVDHVVALGSITHWAPGITDIEAHVEELIEHFASIARKTAVISLYPIREFHQPALILGGVNALCAVTECLNGTDVNPINAMLMLGTLGGLLLANPASRQWIRSNMPKSLANAGWSVVRRVFKGADEVGNWIYQIDTKSLVARLEKKGYDVELQSVDQQKPVVKDAAHGPWDLIIIRKPASA